MIGAIRRRSVGPGGAALRDERKFAPSSAVLSSRPGMKGRVTPPTLGTFLIRG